jgi:hypothetical protein
MQQFDGGKYAMLFQMGCTKAFQNTNQGSR